MITKRLVILQATLLLGLSAVFLLPASPKKQPVGVNLALPTLVGEWFGRDAQVTEKERQVLGADTEFSRKTYSNRTGDEIYVSIVLAGQDMNTSIHRPERCLPAQGWTIANSGSVAIPLKRESNGQILKTTRLYNARPVQGGNIYSLNYYWFVGFNDLTASHMTRTLYDIRDRLMKGYNQRWAYITVASHLAPRIDGTMLSDADRDLMLQDFISRLAPIIHRDSVEL